MGPLTAFAVYIVVWWLTLFVILPLGASSHAEQGIDRGDGGDPGAPVLHNMKRKVVTTTWVSAIAWAVVMAVILSGVIPMDALPTG